MSRLVVLGAGGHGRVVAEAAECSASWQGVYFLDDMLPRGTASGPWTVLGAVHDLGALRRPDDGFVCAVGRSEVRLRLQAHLEQSACTVVSVVHPRAVVSRYAQIGHGSVILAGACVNVGASIGRAVIVNTGATVDHDCVLAEGVHICPGAHLAGGVTVGRGAWIGIGASVRQGVVIGENVTVGAGAAVIGDLPPNVVVVGVPARART